MTVNEMLIYELFEDRCINEQDTFDSTEMMEALNIIDRLEEENKELRKLLEGEKP